MVLATHNPHKVTELRAILGPALERIDLVTYTGPEPEETGLTFAENALLKARAAAAFSGCAAIADDSGICVDALGGEPGVRSARYAGTRDAADNVRLLLARLAEVPEAARTAQFVCAAAFVLPPVAGHSAERVEVASWPGTVLPARSGDGGFGYDPVFRPNGMTGSAAELSSEEKNARSHRAQAFSALVPALRTQLFGRA